MRDMLTADQFAALKAKLRAKCYLSGRPSVLRFPEDIDGSLSADIQYTTDQLKDLLAILNAVAEMECELNIGKTPLSDSMYAVLICNKRNIKKLVVSYELTSKHFEDMKEIWPELILTSLLSLERAIQVHVGDELVNISSSVASTPTASLSKLFSAYQVDSALCIKVLTAVTRTYDTYVKKHDEWVTQIEVLVNSLSTPKKITAKFLNDIELRTRNMVTAVGLDFPDDVYSMWSDSRESQLLRVLRGVKDSCEYDGRHFAIMRERFKALNALAQNLSRMTTEEQLNFQRQLDKEIWIFSDYVALKVSLDAGRNYPSTRQEQHCNKIIQKLLLTIHSPCYPWAASIYSASNLNVKSTLRTQFALSPQLDLNKMLLLFALTQAFDDERDIPVKSAVNLEAYNVLSALKTMEEQYMSGKLTLVDESIPSLDAYSAPVCVPMLKYLSTLVQLTQRPEVSPGVAERIDAVGRQFAVSQSLDERLAFVQQSLNPDSPDYPMQKQIMLLFQACNAKTSAWFAADPDTDLVQWLKTRLRSMDPIAEVNPAEQKEVDNQSSYGDSFSNRFFKAVSPSNSTVQLFQKDDPLKQLP